jgi:hypothetical protein
VVVKNTHPGSGDSTSTLLSTSLNLVRKLLSSFRKVLSSGSVITLFLDEFVIPCPLTLEDKLD